MARGDDNVRVRVPDGMRNRIQAAAAANKRSMNAEVVAMLESAISTNGIRDAFAAAALIGFICKTEQPCEFRGYAVDAYGVADAMLAERSRTNG